MSLFEQLSLFRLPTPPTSQSRDKAKARHILIGANAVAYELRQGARRRLTMSIDERGLRVGAPRHVALADIEAFVRSHGDWVLKKIEEYAGENRPRHLAVRDGVRLPVLGGEALVRVTDGANRIRWQEDTLELAARSDADLNELARRALQRRALAHFLERVGHYAERLGRPAPAVGLSSARTRWGSCSHASGIRLNWRLIHLPPHFADYVIAHELAHLEEMNHSPRFWAVVERIYPDWQQVRADLKQRSGELPLL